MLHPISRYWRTHRHITKLAPRDPPRAFKILPIARYMFRIFTPTMLERVCVEHYKCFDGSRLHAIPFTEETIVMGPNNSGKSAMMTVIDFFRESLWDFPDTRISFSTSEYQLRDISNVVYCHDTSRKMILQIGIGTPTSYEVHTVWNRDQFKTRVFPTIQKQDRGSMEDIQEAMRSIWHLHPVRFVPVAQSINVGVASRRQPLAPDGTNAIQFLLERFTSRDPNWDEAEDWLKKIDPGMRMLMAPLQGKQASIETSREYGKTVTNINLADQGTGIQSVFSVVAALAFSPPKSTIIIEEPEAYLHPRAQEVLVDLMNKAVNEWDKQVIATTHSWDIILPFISDIGTGRKRGAKHPKADPEKFSLVWIDDNHNIQNYDLEGKPYRTVRADAKRLWG